MSCHVGPQADGLEQPVFAASQLFAGFSCRWQAVCSFPAGPLPTVSRGGRDAAFGEDGCGFGEHEARSADRAAAQVDEMPVVGESVGA